MKSLTRAHFIWVWVLWFLPFWSLYLKNNGIWALPGVCSLLCPAGPGRRSMPAHCAEWSVEMPPASGPYSVPTSEVDVGVPALFGVVGFPPPHHHFRLGEPQGILEGFPGGSAIKKPPANAGDIQSLGRKDPLEEEMATHSSILA